MQARLTLLLLCFICYLHAQTGTRKVSIEAVLKQEAISIPAYDTSYFEENQLAVRFAYGSAKIQNPKDYDAIRSRGKIYVEYVYSAYTKSQPGQKELDRRRFESLKKLAPDLFKDDHLEWECVEQTEAKTPEAARQLFHGFVITFQPQGMTEEEAKTELTTRLDCAKRKPPQDAAKYPGGIDALHQYLKTNLPFPKEDLKVSGSTKMAVLDFRLDTTGRISGLSVSKGLSKKYLDTLQAVFKKMPKWQKGNPVVEFSLGIQFLNDKTKGLQIMPGPLYGVNPIDCNGLEIDSAITKVLDRHKDWKKMLVVEDVTGSMMPYIGELLIWNALKGNLKNVEHFTFFNDGDAKADWDKKMGETGGIYHVKPTSIEALENTMAKAIAGGNGGDGPENDIEAVLEGLKACPECEEVVLISDNNVSPRDLDLLGKIGKPLRIILCGVGYYGANEDHLNMALQTKGSVHLIEKDIEDLTKLQEGTVLEISGMKYKILSGKFVKLKRF